jgi:hypothetical protein
MDVDPLFLGRIVERILVVIFGGLFGLAPVHGRRGRSADRRDQVQRLESELAAGGPARCSLRWHRGHGLALSRPLEHGRGRRSRAAATTAETRSVSYLGSPEDLRTLAVLNTFARLDPARLQQDSASATAMKVELAHAQEGVVVMRNLLLSEKFSQADIATWQKYQDAYLQDPRSVPGEVRPTLSALEPWMTSTVADER